MSTARRPTINDVAREAGVSSAVVSYVINNGPRVVAAATRQRVEDAIRSLGYRRDPIAGILSAGRSNLVGLLVPDTANEFFGELSRHIEGQATRRGLVTMLGNTGYDHDTVTKYVTAFSDMRPQGIFVVSVADTAILSATSMVAPIVYLHAAPPDSHLPSVVFDNQEGGATATRHLIAAHGLHDIHCLNSGPQGPTGERVAGWQQAMNGAGIDVAGRLHQVSADRAEVERIVATLLTGPAPPRAIFATTDELALAVVRAAHLAGIHIPQDLAVIGFDGIREALLGSIRLTTMACPLDQVAFSAFTALDNTHQQTAAVQRTLHTTLRIGETCGCVQRT